VYTLAGASSYGYGSIKVDPNNPNTQYGTCEASLQADGGQAVYLSLGFCGGVYILQ
jgi:hypothetical protein